MDIILYFNHIKNGKFLFRTTSDLTILNTSPNVSNWDIEDGYKTKKPQKDYPVRIFNARQGAALSFSPQLFERDLEFMCQDSVQGFQIFCM